MGRRLAIMWTVLLLCLALCQTALAEKTDYVDKKYDFTKVNNILVLDMDFSDVDFNSIRERSFNEVYLNKAKSSKLTVLDVDKVIGKISLACGQDLDLLAARDEAEADRLYGEYLPNFADLYVEAELVRFYSDEIYHPPYTTWETKRDKVKVRDSDGELVEITEEYQVPVHHDGYYEDVFYVDVLLHAYDTKTNKEVFAREDSRSRVDDDGKGMFERICGDFFNDLRKLAKK